MLYYSAQWSTNLSWAAPPPQLGPPLAAALLAAVPGAGQMAPEY